MTMHEQIKAYIATQPEPKRSDMQELHDIILELMPECRLWFLDGKDEKGRTVSNPNIGYGIQIMKYADALPARPGPGSLQKVEHTCKPSQPIRFCGFYLTRARRNI